MRIFFVFILTIITASPGFAQDIGTDKKDSPFYPGEKLTYALKWSFINAGESTLEVLPTETVNGIEAYHFVMTAETNSFVDVFYKVRDRIDAYSDVDMTRSILYKQKQKEGKTNRDIVVQFDWDKKQVLYSNFGKKREPVTLLSGAFDPLSAFYFTRFTDMKEKMVIEQPVTDGKKCVKGRVTVKKREKIKVGGKTFDTWLLEPQLKHVGGVFEKSRDAKIQIWVSADERRIPIRIKSKVIVGSFVGELVRIEKKES
ncbi:MAG: DUF3108 domain-containing protein [Desulfobacterales bacterium]|nr:DUF3108 domain-containing protein [Desulfobacterales bacterium]